MPCGSGTSQPCASYDVKNRRPLCPEIQQCLGNPVDIVCNLKSKFEPHYYTPPKLPLERLTTYKNHYVPWDLKSTHVEAMKPNVKPTLERVYSQMNDSTSENMTWYKYQFPPHKVNCYQKPPWANKRKSTLLQGPVLYTTTFQEGYPPKQGKPAESTKPKHQFLAKHDADFTTSYLTNYLDWNVGPYKKVEGPNAKSGQWAAMDCCSPFSGLSIYKVDFKGPYQEARKSYKPRFTPSRSKFEGCTTYNVSYQPYYFNKGSCTTRTHCDENLTPNYRQQWDLDEKYPLVGCQDWQNAPPPMWTPAPCPPVPECTPCYKLKKKIGTDDSVHIDVIPNENLCCDESYN